jgi:hypothetical protein
MSGNPWAEDPGCYLTDAEIGLAGCNGDSAATTAPLTQTQA